MAVGEDEVLQIIDHFEASKLSKLDWTFGEGRLVLEREQPVQQVVATPVVPVSSPATSPAPTVEEAAPSGTTIDAPLVGVVYLTPEPEKPQFVETGDQVHAGDVVCIIESMKMMNEIRSDVTGTVKAILIENESLVEFGQPLIEIEEGSNA